MRWDKLFDDLETQLERELTAEELDLGVEEERLRLGRLSLRDRLGAIHGQDAGAALLVTIATGEKLRLRPDALGRDWLSAEIEDGSARRSRCILALQSVVAVTLTPTQVRASLESAATDAHSALSQRLGITFVLRDLCRRRRAVEVVITGGTSIHGTIDRVGRDHLDLAVHEPGTARRDSAVTDYRIVSLERLVLVRY
jgi:hypothetical protein